MTNFLKLLYLTLVIFLISCSKTVDVNLYENSFFSFKNKPFTIEKIEVTNLGFLKGKYAMEANLTGKNNIKIHIKYYSITGDKNSCCSLNSGTPIEKGNAPGEFSPESYIIVGDSTYYLTDGWVRFNNDPFDNRTFEISTYANGIILMGQYKGTIDYKVAQEGNAIDSLGTGWFTYKDYKNENSILLSNGSMYHSGYDTRKQCEVYKLFLTNKKGDYLKFLIYSPKEIKAGYISSIDEINHNDITETCYSDLFSGLYISKEKTYIDLQGGSIIISKEGENYIISLSCTDHYYTEFNPVICSYKGKLDFNDMSPLE